jgi:preprotein translocase subunit SecG
MTVRTIPLTGTLPLVLRALIIIIIIIISSSSSSSNSSSSSSSSSNCMSGLEELGISQLVRVFFTFVP